MQILIETMYISDVILINNSIYNKVGNVFHVLTGYDYYEPHGKYIVYTLEPREIVAELPAGKRVYLEFIPY